LFRFSLLGLPALVLVSSLALAQDKQPPASLTAISPIFGQLVMFQLPSTFRTAHEERNAQGYIREAVLAGETAQRWTQMITVTGHKDAAANSGASPRAFVENIAGAFQKACPATFVAHLVAEGKLGGHDAVMALTGCGNVTAGGEARSEIALIIGIKGATDLYSLQWAERGPPMTAAPQLDLVAWKTRADALQPIRLCPIVPGEAAPYPSCVNQR
jgi:hypothetical protein